MDSSASASEYSSEGSSSSSVISRTGISSCVLSVKFTFMSKASSFWTSSSFLEDEPDEDEPDEDEPDEPGDIDSDEGFDPYTGCFTYDC